MFFFAVIFLRQGSFTTVKPVLLLVDQEDRRRNQTIQFLEEGGWNVLHTDNMLNAHPMALRFKPSVIIISDTNADRKGFKACQDIRADHRTEMIPILILSDLSGVADKLQGFQAGADDYIGIPCDFEELFVRTKALLLNRRLINMMPSTTPWEGQLLDG